MHSEIVLPGGLMKDQHSAN